MAHFLSKLKSGLASVDHRKGAGVSTYLVDKAERYAGAAAFGYVKGYYREKASIRGIPADLLAGAGLTAVAALASAFTGGRSAIAPHLNALGDSGMTSYINSIAAAYGAKKSGRKVYVLDAGAKAPAVLPPGLTAVGALPKSGVGSYLTADQIAHYSGKR